MRLARPLTLATTTALLALLSSGSPAAHVHAPTPVLAPIAEHHHDSSLMYGTSSNWSGYAATGGKFTSVSAEWDQPAVTCTDTNTYSAFWVGLDGDGSKSVEQIGTEADCSRGTPYYSSWYEMYPAYPTNFRNPVSPGDHFVASVSTNGNGSFTLTIHNTTAGWSHSVAKTLKNAALASAEVIAEAPSTTSGVLPLADFGTVGFTNASVNGKALSDSNPSVIDMATSKVTKATTSEITDGADFSVTWHHS
ncbi:G1 family glutamic endopeptidase [Kitasatospora sp. NPDC089797]|uniref:G1 family glutamic endopeptidase n=1 Tax=Kitasatospora sp. NPDC089797 TaxID=3155298 RepID=UPI00343D548F